MICIQHVVLIIGMVAVSCSKYNFVDELRGIGSRVEVLESRALELNEGIEALREIVQAVETHGYVTRVVRDGDGSCAVTFSNGATVTLRQGRDGADGRDGREALLDVSVRTGPDGAWYWTVNGEWLTDGTGLPVAAGAIDGRDGADGRDGQDGRDGRTAAESGAVVPQTRINPTTRHWEISTDGGASWTDTGCSADGADGRDGQDGKDGRDGADGKDGKDGADDIFILVGESDDGQSVTFTLRDGRTFAVPIVK